VAPKSFNAFSTEASAALNQGARAISLLGLDINTPPAWRWSSDNLTHVSEAKLQATVALLLEIMRNC